MSSVLLSPVELGPLNGTGLLSLEITTEILKYLDGISNGIASRLHSVNMKQQLYL